MSPPQKPLTVVEVEAWAVAAFAAAVSEVANVPTAAGGRCSVRSL